MLQLKPEQVDETAEDETQERATLDPLHEEGTIDTVPEAAIEAGDGDLPDRGRRRLRDFARRAGRIRESGEDPKIRKTTEIITELLEKRFKPIVYCRFIATANYVAEQLKERLRDRFPEIHTLAVTSETGDVTGTQGAGPVSEQATIRELRAFGQH